MKFFTFLAFFLLSFTLASQSNQSTSHLEKIVLGSGCFWGAEKGYEALPGVVDAVSGYADGYGVRPSYRYITKFINKCWAYKKTKFNFQWVKVIISQLH